MRYYKILFLMFFIFAQITFAQYQIKRSVISNGAGSISNSGYNVKSTLGQPVIGIMSNNIYNNYAGFCYCGDLYVSIADAMNDQIPHRYELFQNYPNPFNPKTVINYCVGANHDSPLQNVNLSIYNILGQKVATLVSQKQTAGSYKVEWNASGFSSGMYFYQLKTNKGFSQTRKLILMR